MDINNEKSKKNIVKKINNDNQFYLNNSGKYNEVEELLIKTEERGYRERKIMKMKKKI